ncbi:Telomere repeat binding factor (TRF) domain containing protein [Naviculisporaceae sp. PSN 640]
MADLHSTLEADLFAALNASEPFSTPLSLPAPEQQPIPQASSQPEPEKKPTPDSTQMQASQPVAETAQMAESAPVQDQQTAQDLEAQSTHDLLAQLNAMTQEPPISFAPTDPELAPSRSPKRERSPDPLDLIGSVKRVKTEDVAMAPQAQGAAQPELAGDDMEAMLKNALNTLFPMPDVQPNTASFNEPVPHSSATATPVPEKVEHKIMKASAKSTYIIRSMSLPVLGNVAVQLLVRLSQQSRVDTDLLLSETESEFRQAFNILRDMFALARKVFSESPLLSPDELEIDDAEDRETIRMSNLATAALSIFGVGGVTLNDIHESFFSIFVQEDGEYKEPLTALLISLKTRLFLDSLGPQTDSQQIIGLLDRLFPPNIEQTLKQRSGDVALNSDEERLVEQVNERRLFLERCGTDEDFKKSLSSQFSSEEFADNLSAFIQSHLGIVIEYAEKYGVNIPEERAEAEIAQHNHQDDEHGELAALLKSEISQHDMTSKDLHSGDLMGDTAMSLPDSNELERLLQQSLGALPATDMKDGQPPAVMQDSNDTSDIFNPQELEAYLAEKLRDTLDNHPSGLPNMTTTSLTHSGHEPNNGLHPEYAAQMEQSQSSAYASYSQTPASAVPTDATGDPLPPNQTTSTAILYERARQAAVAKSNNTARREGLTSTRRPWTPEEEKALMAGLDMVKGPHWSQILVLFGPNGTVSDILKDRSQVQLKDKARNLKLFFLKTNSEMPFYLQSVTGELKTRAPSQAARKEAEEKARQNCEEEQARLQGINILAGGLQSNHHSISSPLAAAPARTAPIAPAVRGVATNGLAGTTHASSHSVPAFAPVPIAPMVKNEPADHHHTPHGNTLPHLQPAPAPPTQPVLKPHPPPTHPSPQQVHQPTPAHPIQPAQPQPAQHHQPQLQQQQLQQQQQQQQATQPQNLHSHTPQQILPAPPAQALTQPQPTTRVPVSQPQQQTSTSQPTSVLPLPANHHSAPDHQELVNHHSTPDHQETQLFERLTAALAAATPTTVSEPQAT